MKQKLCRDRVVSIVRGKSLVGVYVIRKNTGSWLDDGTEILLAEMSPQKADKIIKLWNSK